MRDKKRLYNVLLDFAYDCLVRLGGGRIDASSWNLRITLNETNLGELLEIWYDNVLWVRTERASAVVLGELDTNTIYRIATYLDLTADRLAWERTH